MLMKRLLPCLVSSLFLSSFAQAGAADAPPPTPAIVGNGSSVTGEAEAYSAKRNKETARAPHNDPAFASASPPKVPAIYSEVRWNATAQDVCLHLETRMADPAVADALMSEVNAYDFAPILAPCPASQPLPAVPSPGAAAQMVWRDQMKLPPPEPYIAPGKAITGLRAFMEIRGPRTMTQTFDVFGYALTITATASSYDVDWGDGSWSRGLTSRGGPWPNGDVRHVYTTQGTYTVRVLERWTGTWSLAGGGGGRVDGALSSEGRINAFPVVQVQAVRNR